MVCALRVQAYESNTVTIPKEQLQWNVKIMKLFQAIYLHQPYSHTDICIYTFDFNPPSFVYTVRIARLHI